MKVIKVVTKTGLCLQEYGAEIHDGFARGSYETCREAIKADIIWNATCKDDSGADLIFINGSTISEEIDETDDIVSFIKGIFAKTNDQVVQFVIRIQDDDVYSNVYEITYQIMED